MYLEAVELMEDDSKESMALDIFRQAIGVSVRLCTAGAVAYILLQRCSRLHGPTRSMHPSCTQTLVLPYTPSHYH